MTLPLLAGRDVLLRTEHGSHLYGMARPDSDSDVYVVVAKAPHPRAMWARQYIGDADYTVLDLGTFLHQCTAGVPQALEAMYAPDPEVDVIAGLRAGWYCGTGVLATYQRTIRHFVEAGDDKRRRHALRLARNARDLREHGRFDPRVSPAALDWIDHTVERNRGDDEALVSVALATMWA